MLSVLVLVHHAVLLFHFRHAPKPQWDGMRPVCPSGYTATANQDKAMQGKYNVAECTR